MRRIRAASLVSVLLLCGCGDGASDDVTGSESESGDGDGEGDGDGDGEGDGDGDGDGDDDGDGDGDDPVDPPPLLDLCDPLTFEITDVMSLTYSYAYDVGNVDGQPGDEIVAYHQGEIVSISNGVPTVTPHPLPFGGTRDAVLLRADGDASLDLLVAGATGSAGVHTFLGDGTGTFDYADTTVFAFDLYRFAAAIGPVTDALVSRGSPSLQQYVFTDALADAPAYTPTSTTEPMAGDVDGDGIDELAFGTEQDGVELWARDGDGYTLATTLDCEVPGHSFVQVVIGDIDVDGLGDVMCIHNGNEVVAVSLWTSLGGLEFARQPTVGVSGTFLGSGHVSAFVADLEGDDDPELLFGHSTFVRLGDDGNFGCQQSLGLLINANVALRAGDIDNDGRDELVCVYPDDVLKAYGVP
jgi:hypothetical protein